MDTPKPWSARRQVAMIMGLAVVVTTLVALAGEGEEGKVVRFLVSVVFWMGLAPWMLYVVVRAGVRDGTRDSAPSA